MFVGVHLPGEKQRHRRHKHHNVGSKQNSTDSITPNNMSGSNHTTGTGAIDEDQRPSKYQYLIIFC